MRISWYYAGLMLLIILLFVGGPSSHDQRLFHQVWDAGHVVLFAGLVGVLLQKPLFAQRHWLVLLLLTSVFCLVAGFAIEGLQLLVGRDFDVKDVVKDLLGGYLGYLIFNAWKFHQCTVVRAVSYPLIFGILVWVIWPLLVIIIDEYYINKEFPMMANFETAYELQRWQMNSASASIVDGHARYGSKSMRMDLNPGQYPGVSLESFSTVWTEFDAIKFSIFNTQDEDIEIVLKIHDWQHVKTGYEYADRFNQTLILKSGWNDLAISLADVKAAPEKRQMNVADIASISLFMVDLEKPISLYLDGIRLSHNH